MHFYTKHFFKISTTHSTKYYLHSDKTDSMILQKSDDHSLSFFNPPPTATPSIQEGTSTSTENTFGELHMVGQFLKKEKCHY